MSKESLKNTVFIKRCEEYDRDQLSNLITEGMARLNYRPQGKVMVKPNVVFAYNTKVFGDMNLSIGHKLGMPAITRDPAFLLDLAGAATKASARKLISMRYFQDINHFLTKMLIRRI